MTYVTSWPVVNTPGPLFPDPDGLRRPPAGILAYPQGQVPEARCDLHETSSMSKKGASVVGSHGDPGITLGF